MKKRTSVYIDKDLLAKAKEKKLNLSQLLEWAIKKALRGELSGFKGDSRSPPVGVRGFKSLPPHSILQKISNNKRFQRTKIFWQ